MGRASKPAGLTTALQSTGVGPRTAPRRGSLGRSVSGTPILDPGRPGYGLQMGERVLTLTVHQLRNDLYWVLSVQRAKGKRFVIARGILEPSLQPDRDSTLSILRRAVSAVSKHSGDQ